MNDTSYSYLDGLYVGLLSEDEMRIFNRLCSEQKARRSYEGSGGMMGLAKVRIVHTSKSAVPSDNGVSA